MKRPVFRETVLFMVRLKWVPRFLAASAVAACLALVPVTMAEAKIVPQKSIAGAKLGMTQERVKQKLGRPDGRSYATSPIGNFRYVTLRYGRTKISFDGTKPSSRVINLFTRSRLQRTASGIGVGSTRAQVKRRLPGVTCKVEYGVNHCYLGDFRPGERVTDFRLKRKKKGAPARVISVGIGIVLD